MSWTLDNGVERNAASPDTFELPEAWKRNSLEPGVFAKLIFLTEDMGGERMWVEIKEVSDTGYVGTLANSPAFIEDLEFGDVVTFRPEHIIDIHVNEDVEA